MKTQKTKIIKQVSAAFANKTFRIFLAIVLCLGLIPHMAFTTIREGNVQAVADESTDSASDQIVDSDDPLVSEMLGESESSTEDQTEEQSSEPSSPTPDPGTEEKKEEGTTTDPSTDAQKDQTDVTTDTQTSQAATDLTAATEQTSTTTEKITITQKLENGLTISVVYDKGVFPDNVAIKAEDQTNQMIEDSVNDARWQQNDDKKVAKSYTFDIKIVDANDSTIEYQPDNDAGEARVAFGFNSASQGIDGVRVFHTDKDYQTEVVDSDSALLKFAERDDLAGQTINANKTVINGELANIDGLNSQAAATITSSLPENNLDVVVADAPGFSSYTVDFTYEGQTIHIPGDTQVPLADILSELGITGSIVDAYVTQDQECQERVDVVVNEDGEDLYYVYKGEDGIWYFNSCNPFQTHHGLVVKMDDGSTFGEPVDGDYETKNIDVVDGIKDTDFFRVDYRDTSESGVSTTPTISDDGKVISFPGGSGGCATSKFTVDFAKSFSLSGTANAGGRDGVGFALHSNPYKAKDPYFNYSVGVVGTTNPTYNSLSAGAGYTLTKIEESTMSKGLLFNCMGAYDMGYSGSFKAGLYSYQMNGLSHTVLKSNTGDLTNGYNQFNTGAATDPPFELSFKCEDTSTGKGVLTFKCAGKTATYNIVASEVFGEKDSGTGSWLNNGWHAVNFSMGAWSPSGCSTKNLTFQKFEYTGWPPTEYSNTLYAKISGSWQKVTSSTVLYPGQELKMDHVVKMPSGADTVQTQNSRVPKLNFTGTGGTVYTTGYSPTSSGGTVTNNTAAYNTTDVSKYISIPFKAYSSSNPYNTYTYYAKVPDTAAGTTFHETTQFGTAPFAVVNTTELTSTVGAVSVKPDGGTETYYATWEDGWNAAKTITSGGKKAIVKVLGSGSSIYASSAVTLTSGTYELNLNGNTVYAPNAARTFVTNSGATLNITGTGTISGRGSVASEGGFCYINSGSTVNITGTSTSKVVTLKSFTTSSSNMGGCFGVAGNLNITNGTITSCTSGGHAGAIVFYSGTVKLNSGCTISNCNAGSSGGNDGGAVRTGEGGSGSVYMYSGAKVTGCTANYGAAICLCSTSKFIMNGGEICNNTGKREGALHLQASNLTFEMYGGSIHDNKATDTSNITSSAGAVSASFTNGTMKVGGSAQIYNNYKNNGSILNNINIGEGRYLQVAKAFTSDAKIGVYTTSEPSAGSAQQVTTGTYTINNCAYFTSDRSGFSPMLSDYSTKNIVIGYPTLSVKATSTSSYDTYGTWNGGWEAVQNINATTLDARLDAACTATDVVDLTDSKTFNFYLNGNQITAASAKRVFTVGSGTTLNIKDSTSNGENEDNNGNAVGTLKGNGSVSANGGCVYVNGGGTLNFGGGTISSFNASKGGAIAASGSSAKVTMTSGTIDSCKTTVDTLEAGGGVYIEKGGSLVMSGGTIQNCTAAGALGGGIAMVSLDSSLPVSATIKSGAVIQKNSATGTKGNTGKGGGIITTGEYSTLNLQGGTIKSNTATRYGGGIEVNQSNMTMSSGSIDSNSAPTCGGLEIWQPTSKVTATGGSITNNKATTDNGGGVWIRAGVSSFTGVTITGNTAAQNGGGIFTYNSGDDNKVTLNNVTIKSNTATSGNGAGVYYEGSNTNIAVGGSTTIASNTNASTKGNVYIKSGNYLSYSSTALTSSASIGVMLENTYGAFTDANNTDYHARFTSDAGKPVNYNTNGGDNHHKVEILNSFTITKNEYSGVYDRGSHASTISSSYSDTTITYSESASGIYTEDAPSYTNANTYTTYWKAEADGYVSQSGTLTTTITRATLTTDDFNYTPPSDLVYSATEKQAKVEPNANTTGVGTITITYLKGGTATSPTNIGTYVCQISVTQGQNWNAITLSDEDWNFTITKATLDVTWQNDEPRTYDGNASNVLATVTGYKGSDTATISYTNNKAYKAGTYTAKITLKGANIANYEYNDSMDYTINKLQLTPYVQNGKVDLKTYNGDKYATASTDAIGLNGVLTPSVTDTKDEVTATYDEITYVSPDAGPNKTLNVWGISLTGDDSSNYSVAENLKETPSDAVIEPKPVTIQYTLESGASLIYDHTEKTGLWTAKVPESELVKQGTVKDTCNVSIVTKEVEGKEIYDAGVRTLVATIDNGNYTIKQYYDTKTYTILQKSVEVTSVDVKTSQTYDGSTGVKNGIDSINFEGVLDDDAANITISANYKYSSATAGEDKKVALDSIALSGTRAANYALKQTTGEYGPSKTGKGWNTIDPLTLTEFEWYGYNTRTYDGNPSNVYADAKGVIEGDIVTLKIEGGDEKNANMNSGEYYTATATSIEGKDKDNYQLPEDKPTKDYVVNPATLNAAYLGGEVVYKTVLPDTVKQIAVTGFVDGESEKIKGFVKPTCDFEGSESWEVGQYELTPEGGYAPNYKFIYSPGRLVIKSREFHYVEGHDYIGEYDGKGHTISVTKSEEEKEVKITITYFKNQADATQNKGGTTEPTLYTDVTNGEKIQWFRVDAEGYTPFVSYKTVTIKPKKISYVVSTKDDAWQRIYDGTTDASPNVDISVTPLEVDKGKVGITANINFTDANTSWDEKSVVVSDARLTGEKGGNYEIDNTTSSYSTEVWIYPKHVEPVWLNATESDLTYSGTNKNVKCALNPTCQADIEKENVVTTNGNAKEVLADSSAYYTATAEIKNHNYTFGEELTTNPIWTTTYNYKILRAHLKASYVSEYVNLNGSAKGEVLVTGFVNGETPPSANSNDSNGTVAGYTAPTVTGLETTSTGTTTHSPSNGKANNYTFDYKEGTLNVLDANADYLTVTTSGYSGEYNAASHAVSVDKVVSKKDGKLESGTYSIAYYKDASHSKSTTATRTDVTSETIYIVVSYINSDGETVTADAQADITITPKYLTVTWDGYSNLMYDGSSHTVSASVTPCSADVGYVSVETSGNEQTDAGGYIATATGLTAGEEGDKSGNYRLKTEDTSMTKTFVIAKRPITLTSATDTQTYTGSALTNDSVTDKLRTTETPVYNLNSNNDTAGFVGSDGASYNVTGTITDVGDTQNIFTYSLNEGTSASNYDIQTVNGKLSVTTYSDQVVVTIKGHNNGEGVVYDGTAKSVTGYDIESIKVGEEETSLFTAGDIKCTNEKLIAESNQGGDAGKYPMGLKGTSAGEECNFFNTNSNFADDNVIFNVTDGYVKINKRQVELTSDSASKTYDSTPLTRNAQSNVSVTSDLGWVNAGEKQQGATYNITGTVTDVQLNGEGTVIGVNNTFSYTLNENTKADNYEITTVSGTLTINKRDVTVTSNDIDVMYDGDTHYNHTISVSAGSFADGEGEGKGVTYSKFTSVKNASYSRVTGSKTGTKNDYKITFDDTQCKSTNYNLVQNYGTLYVYKRHVSFTSKSNNKVYDGTPLTANEQSDVVIGIDGFPENKNEGATFTFDTKSTITNVGTQDNIFTYKLNDGTSADNYDVDALSFGTLKVSQATPSADKFTYTPVEKTPYDGETREATITLNEPLSPEPTSIGAITVKYYKVDSQSGETYLGDNVLPKDYGKYKVKIDVAGGQNFSKLENVTANDWTIEIDKRQVSVSSETKEGEANPYWVYDGQPHQSTNIKQVNFVEGEGEKIIGAGFPSVTNYNDGKPTNSFECIVDPEAKGEKPKLENYQISYTFGTIAIKPRSIVLTSATDEKTYDSTALTNSTVTDALDTTETTGTGFVKNWKTGWDAVNCDVTGTITDQGTVNNEFTYTAKGQTDLNNYYIRTLNGTLTINAVETAVTVTVSGNTLEDITYDAQEHTVSGYELSAEPKAEGDLYLARIDEFMQTSATTHVNGTNVGNYYYNLQEGQFANITSNFDNVVFEIGNDGGFTIDKRNINYTGQSKEVVYNGEVQEFNDIKVEQESESITGNTGLLNGHTFSLDQGMIYSVSGERVNNQTPYDGAFYGDPYITDENGNAVSSNYSDTRKIGQLVITPKPIDLTADNKTVIYDGEVVKYETYSATPEGMCSDQTLNYSFTTDRTARDIGTYTIKVSGDAVQEDYAITYHTGTLEIKARPVTVTADDHKSTYTGKPLDPESEHLTATVTGAAEGETSLIKYTLTVPDNVIDTGMYEITSSGTQIQGNYEVSYRAGTLTVVDADKIILKFNNNGHGMWQADQQVDKGGLATEPETPRATGYEFSGWHYDKEATQVVDFEKDTFDEDTTLYAGWTVANAAEVGGYKFTTIQEAINSSYAKEDGAVVKVLRDVLEPSIVLAPDGQEVTLDLCGFAVTGDIFVYGDREDHHGKLTLIDSSVGTVGGLIGSLTPYNFNPEVKTLEGYIDVQAGYYSCNPTPYVDITEQRTVVAAEGEQKDKGFACYIGKNTSKEATLIVADEIICKTEVGEGVKEEDTALIQEQIINSTTAGLANSLSEESVQTILDEGKVTKQHLKEPGNVVAIEMIITVRAENSDVSAVDKPFIEYSVTPSALVTVTDKTGQILSQEIEHIDNELLNGNPITVNLPVVGSFEPREVIHVSKGGTVIDVFHKSGTYMFGYDYENKLVSLDITEFSEVTISANVEYGCITFVDNFQGSTDFYKQNEKLESDVTLRKLEFAHPGYHFAGWSTREDGTGQKYTDGAEIDLTADRVLYGNWVANNYTVHFDGNGADGGGMADQLFTYDAPAVGLATNGFTKTNEVFLGWSQVPGGEIVYGDCEPVQNLTTEENGVVTLYAKWDNGEAYNAWLASQTAASGDDTIPLLGWIRSQLHV